MNMNPFKSAGPGVVRNDAMNKRIKGYFANAASNDDVIYAFVEGYSLATDSSRWLKDADQRVPAHQFKNSVNIGALIAMHTSKSMFGYPTKVALVNNPLFALNGHDDNPSNATEKYLINYLSQAKSTFLFNNTAPSKIKVAYHLNALGSTEAHLHVLKAMAKSTRETGTVAEWLGAVIQMKRHKRKVRGAGFAGAAVGCVVPHGSLLSLPVVTYLKSGKATLEFTCVAAALELHWRAFQEQTISRNFRAFKRGMTGGTVGPASRILWELFKGRGAQKVLSKGEIAEFVAEPAGWIPIKERLLAL